MRHPPIICATTTLTSLDQSRSPHVACMLSRLPTLPLITNVQMERMSILENSCISFEEDKDKQVFTLTNLLLPMEENSVDWEETVRRDGWTPLQHRIFNKVLIIFTIDSIQFSKILISTIFNRLSNCLLLITWQG